jgi:hypothetical protein
MSQAAVQQLQLQQLQQQLMPPPPAVPPGHGQGPRPGAHPQAANALVHCAVSDFYEAADSHETGQVLRMSPLPCSVSSPLIVRRRSIK